MGDDTDPFKRLVQGTGLVFVGNFVGLGATFLTRIIAANHLAPGGYGLVVLGASIVNIIAIVAMLGIPSALGQRLPRVDDKPELFRDVVIVTLPLALIAGFVLGTFADVISQILNEPGFARVLVAFSISLPFFVVMKLTVAGFRGLESAVGRVIVENLSHQGLKAVAVIGISLFGAGSFIIAIGWAGAFVVSAVLGVIYLELRSKLVTGAGWRIWPNVSRTRSILAFSLPLVLSSGVVLMLQYGDNFLLGYFRSSEVVGIYDAAYTLAKTLLIAFSTFKFLFVPMFSKLDAADNRVEMGRLYRLVAKWVSLSTFPIFFIFVFFPKESLELLFRAEYSAGSTALVVLSIGFFLHLLMGLNAGALVALGHSRSILMGNIVSFIFNIGLNLLLIPKFGILGAAVGSMGSYTLMNILYQYNLVRRENLNPFPKSVILPFVVSTGVFGLPALMFHSTISQTVLTFLLFISIFVLLYGLVILIIGFDAEDIDFIISAVDRTPLPTDSMRSALERLNRG